MPSPTDKQWKELWFDLKVNAKGHFESHSMYSLYDSSLGPLAIIGGWVSAPTVVAQRMVGLLKENRLFNKTFPYFFLMSCGAIGMHNYCQFSKKAEGHHKTGVKYNQLARRVEEALLDSTQRTSVNWKDINDVRNKIEEGNCFNTSNRVHAFASGIVLHRKTDTAMPPWFLKYVGPLSQQEKSNLEHKKRLMSTPLEHWK